MRMVGFILAVGLLAGAARAAQKVELVYPNGLAMDREGNLLISDVGTHRVLKLERDGKLTVVAGTGEAGFEGDGGPAASSRLNAPTDILFDGDGNLLIADTFNHRIRKIDGRGMITTIVGDGKTQTLNNPQSMALDREGNLFIADTYNHVVKRVDREGKVSVFAGTEAGLAGDKGPANKAQLNLPQAVAVGLDGAVYISDSANSRIRRVKDGVIETIAGSGPGSGEGGAGFGGDGQAAGKAKLFSPTDLKFNSAGQLYVADSGNNRVRMIVHGVMMTVAGGTAEIFNAPQKIAVGREGEIYVSDRVNHRVRKVDANGVVTTVVSGSDSKGILVDPSVLRLEKTQNQGK